MNKKGQIDIKDILIIILIIGLIIGIVVYVRIINENKRLQNLVDKSDIEFNILKNIIQDYYTLSNDNLRNTAVNLRLPCYDGTRAFSENGLIEYNIACISNSTWVVVPILYNNHSTKLYIWNGTIIPVVLDALNKTR
jgi:hypothetical protein